MIRTEGLTKVFKVGFRGRKVRALEDLTFEVKEGEIFGFLGPNGAGKTTTIKILTGLLYPTKGKAWIMGRELGDISVKERMGFLPENPSFYEYLTGMEFLTYYAQLLRIPSSERQERVGRLFSMVGLKGAEDLQLRRYSKGMIQRIGIAQALLNDPDLVILDEPMSGLDPIGRKEVRDLILRLRDEGKTVFFSTHILSDVEMICDRVAILAKGRLKAIGPLEDLLGGYIKSVEVTVRGLREEVIGEVEAMAERVLRRDDSLLVSLKGEEETTRLIDLIRMNGGRIYSIVPQRLSLEEYFMKMQQEAEGPGGRR